ncbi:MAG TPA: alanine--tRNA ligase [Nitrososphaerales archaeon]|nr:alanine--tRNA ligase [Nitrososphaerales archaeon]HUK75907.1 alanine--tRNA ligase [Nitrososphaerales archaeon]
MPSPKEILQERFSGDYEKYYTVDLFRRKGFIRKTCPNCGKHFWTLKPDRKLCDDSTCSPYAFIGDAPTKKRLDYTQAWDVVERFFVKNGHASIPRYPVVARWRPDLFFTVASIVDFQRIENGKVVFELPTNPLVVPQMCLRFNDVPSVGVSGKHGTSFCMIGQTAIANKDGYWKDRCIDLDFELLTKEFGIPEQEVSFIESVWVGAGAFGYSLEYFVRGLEAGNAVFTAFEGDPASYRDLPEKVVDMGAGLERLSWITTGTPTYYDTCFAPVLAQMTERSKVEYDKKLFERYSKLAGAMNLDEYPTLSDARKVIAKSLGVDADFLAKALGPMQAMYAVADHARTLLFAVTDGLPPSNVGGGYNLRVLFRRAQSFIDYHGFKFQIVDVVNWHIDQLQKMYPELKEHRDDVSKVLAVESARYSATVQRVSRTVASLAASRKEITVADLVKLYDSDGITPEQLVEGGARVAVPEDFYQRVVAKHVSQKVEEKRQEFEIAGLPETRPLYYEDGELFEFEAKVLKTFPGGYVVLDQTAFYPRGGGQEPDHGTIADRKVVDIEKDSGVILHKVEGLVPKEGSKVVGRVDSRRRQKIRRIHTATHIVNGASRQVLGPWVWQHSAFKEEDYGRLDITHFAKLTDEEVRKIEDVANDVVMKDYPVKISLIPRKEAEAKYGFRLFQGGVVPQRTLRIVNINDWDIQACGGTHTDTTGQVGFIKIMRTERIQDGVERLVFVSGYPAVDYVQKMDSTVEQASAVLGTQRENVVKVISTMKQELEDAEKREKALGEKLIEASVPRLVSSATALQGPRGKAMLYVSVDGDLSDELIVSLGEKLVKAEPSLVDVTISPRGNSTRIVCFVGPKAKEAGVAADALVKELSKALGGSGGGSKDFAQGGGPKPVDGAAAKEMVAKSVSGMLGK